MQTPLYTAFFTTNTIYEQEAARLRRSLDRLGLEHDIRPVADRGDWMKNAALTASHVCAVLADHPDRFVVQLDADAVVWSHPKLFDELIEAGNCDVAVHYRAGVEMLNGTVFFAPTAAAKAVAATYLDLIESCPGCTNEQTMLAKSIEQHRGAARIVWLPAAYAWIGDIHKREDLSPFTEPVIEHLQASREWHKSPMLPSRLRRLAEIEGLV